MKRAFRVRVEAYAGYRGDERPTAFWLKERRIEVREILDRWYGEDADYFKVAGDDGVTYILCRLRSEDSWLN